jgi:hypothetical protein
MRVAEHIDLASAWIGRELVEHLPLRVLRPRCLLGRRQLAGPNKRNTVPVVPAPAIARAAGKQEREPQMVVAGQRSAALAAALLRSARLLMPVLIAVLPCQMSSAARGSSVCEANAGLRELTRCGPRAGTEPSPNRSNADHR